MPGGEVLPAYAMTTITTRRGTAIKVPSMWNNGGDVLGGESAIGMYQRRMSDAEATGENPNDPNVMYREMARVADDAAARGLTPAQTGMVHLDRFQRGANGETGFVNGAGTANAPDPHVAAWRTAIGNTVNPSTAGASPVSGFTPGLGGGAPQTPPAPTAAPTAPPAQTGSAAGGQPSYYGQAPGILAENPGAAYRALLQRVGIDPAVHGQFEDYLKKHLANATVALINAARGNGQLPTDINATLNQIGQQAFGPNGNWNQYTSQIADNTLKNLGSTYGTNARADQVEMWVQQLLGLKAEGLNAVAGSDLSNSYLDTVGGYGDVALQNGGVDKSNFLPYFQKTKLYNRLVPGVPQP